MVSACLLGENVKYNGGNNRDETLLAFLQDKTVLSICPEVMGGLPCPRPCGEIVDGVVRTADGKSVDAEYRRGAAAALDIAKKNAVDLVVLQQRSPSCGVHMIYDGTFTGRKIPGHGAAAALLIDAGFATFDSSEIVQGQQIVPVDNPDDPRIESAAMIHAVSWRDSHREICSPDFLAGHTYSHQLGHLREQMDRGARLYVLYDTLPVALVTVADSLIENLYVLPCMQNKGYGTHLLHHAMAQCAGTPTLWILSTNTRAAAWYDRLGFTPTGNRHDLTPTLYEYEMKFTR